MQSPSTVIDWRGLLIGEERVHGACGLLQVPLRMWCVGLGRRDEESASVDEGLGPVAQLLPDRSSDGSAKCRHLIARYTDDLCVSVRAKRIDNEVGNQTNATIWFGIRKQAVDACQTTAATRGTTWISDPI
jgi:hypothetical protein